MLSAHQKLDLILSELKQLRMQVFTQGMITMSDLDNLEASVTAQTSVIESAKTLMGALKTALDAAVKANDMSRVAAVVAKLDAETSALAAAVQANTPAAPPAPPPPPAPPATP